MAKLNVQRVEYMTIDLVRRLPNTYSLIAGICKAARLFDKQEISYQRLAKIRVQSLRYDHSLTSSISAFWDPVQIACADTDTAVVEYIDYHAKIRTTIGRTSV